MTADMTKIATTSDFSAFLKPEQAQDYFAEVEKTSIVQTLARKVPMGPTGIDIPHWTGSVSASWVGETEQKPLTKGSFGHQTLTPTKIAVIFAESAEVVRANPMQYLETMRTKIAEAIAVAFDAATLHGINKPTAFKGYLTETTQASSFVDPGGAGVASATDAYSTFVNVVELLAPTKYKWTGTVLDDETEPYFLNSRDANNRPLFIESTYGDLVDPLRSGRIIGRPSVFSDHVANGSAGSRVLGVAGDFTQAIWGQVGGLSFDVTDQATLDFSAAGDGSGLISLWQHNLVAVRAEAEYAFLVNDKDAFVKLTDSVTA